MAISSFPLSTYSALTFQGITQRVYSQPLFGTQSRLKTPPRIDKTQPLLLEDVLKKTYRIGYLEGSDGHMKPILGQDAIDALGQNVAYAQGGRWVGGDLRELLGYPPDEVIENLLKDLSHPNVRLIQKGWRYHRLTELGQIASRLSRIPKMKENLLEEETLLKKAYQYQVDLLKATEGSDFVSPMVEELVHSQQKLTEETAAGENLDKNA